MGILSSVLSIGGAAIGGAIGGPMGAKIGGALGGAAGGALSSSGGSSKATAAQLAALQQAQGAIKDGTQQAVNAQQPYQQLGTNALSAYGAKTGLNGQPVTAQNALSGVYVATPDDYMKSPAYDYLAQEAQKQTLGAASKAGLMLSGPAAMALQDRAFNLAKTDYADWRNYTTGRADQAVNNDQWAIGVGQGAANQVGNAYTTQGQQLANLYGLGGQVQAANALTQGQIGANLSNDVAGILASGFQPQPTNALDPGIGGLPTSFFKAGTFLKAGG